MPKLQYFWRVTDPGALTEVAQICDQQIIARALAYIIGIEQHSFSDRLFDLISLPINLFGLGIDRPSHTLLFANLAAR